MAASCVVCHELLCSNENTYAAKCGHVLHYLCWTDWLKRHSSCPQCRRSTETKDLIRLFLNREDSINEIDLTAGSDESLPSQNFDSKGKPQSFNVKSAPEVILMEDSDSDCVYSLEDSDSVSDSDADVVVLDHRPPRNRVSSSESETTSDAEVASSLSGSDSTSGESSIDDSESDDPMSDDSGSEVVSCSDGTGSTAAQDEESTDREDSDIYETGSELGSRSSSESGSDESTD